MKTFTRLLAIALVAVATLTACSDRAGGIFAPSPPMADQSPSGVWGGQAVTPGAPDASTVSTSFETNAVAPFSVGTSPFSATFSNGNAESRGIPSFYITGDNAWHVLVGTSATVTFETPSSTFIVLGANGKRNGC